MLEYFAGYWHLKRRVGERSLGEGRASFIEGNDDNELFYQEQFSYLTALNVKSFRTDKYRYENGEIAKYLYENNSYKLFYVLCFAASSSIVKAAYRC